MYVQAWRRPTPSAIKGYTRGLTWLVAMLGYMALMGLARSLFGGAAFVVFALVALAAAAATWSFTAWLMLLGQVRWRVLVPPGIITGIAMTGYALSATVWMPNTVTSNQHQYGFFGVALALVTWFSGAAICIMVGACAGPVLAEDPGPIGRFVRGPAGSVLVEGAPPSLPPPVHSARLTDAFGPSDDDRPHGSETEAAPSSPPPDTPP